jgi:tRNA threonylcarbamoyladenosine biosynthesis protein TsaE
LRLLVAVLCLAAFVPPALAHPHVFIDYAATVLCRGDSIVGVRLAWTFDEMYSASLFHDYTSQPSGPLSAADMARLNKEAFQDSAEQHFFTDITFNGKPVLVAKATDFAASYDGRRMTYRFTVPLDLTPARGANTLDIDSFDTEFYIDYELARTAPATVEGGAQLKPACAAAAITKDTTTFGPMTTHIVRCRFNGAA